MSLTGSSLLTLVGCRVNSSSGLHTGEYEGCVLDATPAGGPPTHCTVLIHLAPGGGVPTPEVTGCQP